LVTVISEFQSEGAFGPRHIHKLPCAVTPMFNEKNLSHMRVVDSARLLSNSLKEILPTTDAAEYVNPSKSNIQTRRRKIREVMSRLPEYNDYEDACCEVFRASGYDC